ncbi:MAG: hypothetical protein UU48_C0001G0117 [Candidatus Uhrbacteria bacterium GW2011_GWF2_41_16]|uniref:Uncharacterized protein n=2 Tax=Candidatus Uhriibacteriota TaxID=1752732 RepID=A0A0G0YEK9_9BACT|nr:MAG: hypothetical protein UU31_C0002G0070 [Candidatus Uhrbacteria bacterium GW2011_GWA2_41_10]KKR87823.1 MAG: hypothetical protein UU35_C0001G0104 [Candidatus Uhrbacteria bacterium GW2011_GWC2_41_11]KKR98762.1 MAG: hypothetical protein UU48_C0001G0117 [Candidatus Uhrbacteria bacterium GW2011_GWF2_41_16]HBP00120.1 hypothetical protein [Candidatus Uhrbacteria bacterium]
MIEHLSSIVMQEWFFRFVRVLSLFAMIIFIHSILFGAFKHMNASGRDDLTGDGRKYILTGTLGAIAMMMFFFMASAALAD